MPHFFEYERNKSSIPRPVSKQLLTNGRVSGINHASKPSTDTIPLTPSRKINNKTNLIFKHEELRNKQEQTKINNNFREEKESLMTKTNQHILKDQTNQLLTPPEPTTRLDPNPEISILELIPFGKQPYLSFDRVPIHTTQIKFIGIRNLLNSQQQLFIKTFPKLDKGFNIDATEFLIAPKSEIIVALSWTPTVIGSFRETITLVDNDKRPRRIVINASSIKGKAPSNAAKSNVVCKRKQVFSNNLKSSAVRLSPSKLLRASATKSSKKRQCFQHDNKHLTRLVFANRRRQSGLIVKKILSQYDEQMATKIQSYWRMILARRELERLRKLDKATSIFQSYCRGFLCRLNHQERIKAAVKIQSFWRATLARMELKRLKKLESSTINFQSYCRGFLFRLNHRKSIKAAVSIQSYWRMILARRELMRLRKLSTATLAFQSHCRGFLCRINHQKRIKAAVSIQSYWRMILARRELERLRKLERSTTIFQSHCRGFLCRLNHQKRIKAAVVIQSYWRMTLARRELERLRKLDKATTIFQSYCRGFLCRLDHQKRVEAAVSIQSYWRMILARRELERLRKLDKATSIFQSYCRGFLCRLNHRKRVEAAVSIQSHWRMILARRELMRLRKLNGTTTIFQSYCRGFLFRLNHQKNVKAAVSIQSYWRMILARRELMRLRKLSKATLVFQSYCRGFLYRYKLRRSIHATIKIMKRESLRNRLCNQK